MTRTRLRPPAARLVTLAAAWVLALTQGASSAIAAGSKPPPDAYEVVVEAVRDGGRLADLKASLVSLGPQAIPEMFAVLVKGRILIDGEPLPLPLQTKLAVQLAIATHPSEYRSFLDEGMEGVFTRTERIHAIRLLRQVGESVDIERLLSLAPAPSAAAADRAARRALCDALTALLRRSPTGIDKLVDQYRFVRPDLRTAVVESIAAVRAPHTVPGLAKLLGLATEMDPFVLFHLSRSAADGASVRPETSERVRAGLESRDPTVLRLAVPLVVTFRDHESIPQLITLLEDPDEAVRALAHGALGRLTRALHPPDPRLWRGWYARELAWWREESQIVAARLNGELAPAMAAVREVARHRLYPEELGRLLLPVLERPEWELQELACWAIAVVGARDCCPQLLPLLENEHEAVRRSAWEALRWLTGLDLPRTPAAWKHALHHPSN